ncbi:hypothetical protein L208DRAFT_27995 [Tricholoma matsutake]|nr:hypothetical protein L208DRAFT_27995 [Tricholoma matsutake 945]
MGLLDGTIAPEIFLGLSYSFGVDSWAAAIILFIMLTGRFSSHVRSYGAQISGVRCSRRCEQESLFNLTVNMKHPSRVPSSALLRLETGCSTLWRPASTVGYEAMRREGHCVEGKSRMMRWKSYRRRNR